MVFELFLGLIATVAPLLPDPSIGPATIDTLGPLYISRDPGGPLIVVREQARPALVTIRLSVPIEEPPDLIGAGRVLQSLVRDRARSETSRFGGRIQLSRTPSHLIYSVDGPAAAFGEMVAILRYAIAPPRGPLNTQNAAWLSVRQEELARSETPDLLIRSRLERTLFPDLTAIAGAGPAEIPDRARLEEFWRRSFRADAISVIVVGAVGAEEVRAAFRGLELTATAQMNSPSPKLSRADEAQRSSVEVVSMRMALGYPGGSIEPAVLACVAALIDDSIDGIESGQAAAEFWWVAEQTAIVLIGALPIGKRMSWSELRTALQLSMADALAELTAEDLSRTRRRLHQALLMRARTPSGMAAVLGEFLDRTGDPLGADRFLSALEAVDLESVRSAGRTLLYSSPLMVVLEP